MGKRGNAALYTARQACAERIRREFQLDVSKELPERKLVLYTGRSQRGYRKLETGIQHVQITQLLEGTASRVVCKAKGNGGKRN